MTVFARTLLGAAVVVPPVAPVAHAFSTSVAAGSTNNVMPLNITGNFTSVAVSTNATNGSTVVSGSTSIQYTPFSSYSGPDSFDYTATGPGGTSPPALASITVNPPPFTPVTNTYTSTGVFTETAPTGATNVTITAWGPGGGGVFLTAGGTFGAGGGGQAVFSVPVSPGDVYDLVVTAGGIGVTNSSPGGTGSPTQVTGPFGPITANSGHGATSSAVGAGGTATGGTTNTTGAPGAGGNGGAGANGGAGGLFAGANPVQPGGGGAAGQNGAPGMVSFAYT